MSEAQLALLELNGESAELRDAVFRIRRERPGLVAKQVHAALIEEQPEAWTGVSISEVKRLCSKLAKAEVAEHAGEAGPWQHLMPTASNPHVRSKYELARDLMQDPLTRNVEEFKMARPGLPFHGTTLGRGDRLGTAAERGDTQQVIKLLKKGVDPNFQNAASGVTPLGVACERGHVGAVRALLDAKASTEIATAEGYRPLHIASQFGKRDVVELLCRRGKADVHARCPLQDTFPLLLATNFDFVDVMKVLLAQRADPNFVSSTRCLTSLHYVFSAAATVALVAAHADVNHCENHSCVTPLHSCASAGCPEACVALLACGADPMMVDADGIKCVELALETGGASQACAHAILGYLHLGSEILRKHEELMQQHVPFMDPAEVRAFAAATADVGGGGKGGDADGGGSAHGGGSVSGGGGSEEGGGGGSSRGEGSSGCGSEECSSSGGGGGGGGGGRGDGGDGWLSQNTSEDAASELCVGQALLMAQTSASMGAVAVRDGSGADVPAGSSALTEPGGSGRDRKKRISLEEHLMARALVIPLEEVLAAGKRSLSRMIEAVGEGSQPPHCTLSEAFVDDSAGLGQASGDGDGDDRLPSDNDDGAAVH